MNIALVAHDKKKELMVDFCIAYKLYFKNIIYMQRHTGTIIAEETGLCI